MEEHDEFFKKMIFTLGLRKKILPTLMLFTARKSIEKYLFADQVFSAANIKAFIEKAFKKDPKLRYIRSEELPKNSGNLVKLVSLNYQEALLDVKKEAIVLFTSVAINCESCQRFEKLF